MGSYFEDRLAMIRAGKIDPPRRRRLRPRRKRRELKPCRFCGTEWQLLMVERAGRCSWVVCCWCGARGPQVLGGDAIEAWNTGRAIE